MVKNKAMDNEKICVIMSTYNGEKYLEEQLDSLFKQTYPNIKIFVRDDGSNDRTIEILENYKKQGNLEFIKGKNLGYAKSFIEALKLAGDFDYYAFCDQDDVWLPNKLEEAINKLKTKNLGKPLLYFSNVNVCDGNLNFVRKNNNYKIFSFANSLVEVISLGNTIVFNNKLRKFLFQKNSKHIYTHDGYFYTLASAVGEVYYDKEAYINYRRHGNTVTDQSMSFFKLQVWRIKKFIINNYFLEIKNSIIEFKNNYYSYLNDEDKKLLSLFANKKYNLFIALKKFFYPHRFRQKLIDEILIRLVFLTGVI